jgi:hypothetical protein
MTPILGAIGLYIFSRIAESIAELNKNVAVVIEKIERHEKEIGEARDMGMRHSEDMQELKLELAKRGLI